MTDAVKFENTALPDIVELKNISQSYDGGKSFVIQNVNFLIEDKPKQGQFVVILGPSGCGKSTVLRYLAGLQKPTTGEVLLFAKPRTEADHIGMVFQKYSSFPWLTVFENLELPLKLKGTPKRVRAEKVQEMLKLVDLEQHAKKYAQYPSLSGGQLQRVAIGRSLLGNSKILLMDEPFGALDIKTRLRMQELLQKIWDELSTKDEATTIIFVTHDISEAVYLADEIWIMSKAPAQILDRVQIPFGLKRSYELKRTPAFKDLVCQLEDKMMER